MIFFGELREFVLINKWACASPSEINLNVFVVQSICSICWHYILKNKSSKRGFSQQCHKRTILGTFPYTVLKKNHFFLSVKNILIFLQRRTFCAMEWFHGCQRFFVEFKSVCKWTNCFILCRAHEQDLSKRLEMEIDELSASHNRETQIMLSDFNKAQELLKDKISALQILWVPLSHLQIEYQIELNIKTHHFNVISSWIFLKTARWITLALFQNLASCLDFYNSILTNRSSKAKMVRQM